MKKRSEYPNNKKTTTTQPPKNKKRAAPPTGEGFRFDQAHQPIPTAETITKFRTLFNALREAAQEVL